MKDHWRLSENYQKKLHDFKFIIFRMISKWALSLNNCLAQTNKFDIDIEIVNVLTWSTIKICSYLNYRTQCHQRFINE